MKEGRLCFNNSNRRYGILSHDASKWLDPGLSCGTCLQILVDGTWIPTRMEMDFDNNWYLVNTSYRGDLEYIRVRM